MHSIAAKRVFFILVFTIIFNVFRAVAGCAGLFPAAMVVTTAA
jgi:hypothetical protein